MERLRTEYVSRIVRQREEYSQKTEAMTVWIHQDGRADPEEALRGSQSTEEVEDEVAGQIAVREQVSEQEVTEEEVTGVGQESVQGGETCPDQG